MRGDANSGNAWSGGRREKRGLTDQSALSADNPHSPLTLATFRYVSETIAQPLPTATLRSRTRKDSGRLLKSTLRSPRVGQDFGWRERAHWLPQRTFQPTVAVERVPTATDGWGARQDSRPGWSRHTKTPNPASYVVDQSRLPRLLS